MSDTPGNGQVFAAELIGTFVLVLAGVGTAVVTGADVTSTALAFGISVLAMAYALGRVSGGHFNPAVTLAAALGGRVAWARTWVYVLAQLVGGLLGATVLWLVLHAVDGFDSTTNGFGANGFGGSGIAWWGALVLETVMTLVFTLVILSVTDARNDRAAFAPLVIGLTLTMLHLMSIPLTGTSVNPARSIAAAAYGGEEALKHLWLFILAPLLGGALGGLVYPLVFGHGDEPVPGSGLRLGRPAAPAYPAPAYGAPGYPADPYAQQWQEQGHQPPAQQGWDQQQPPAPAPGQTQSPLRQPTQARPPEQQPWGQQQPPPQQWPGQQAGPQDPPDDDGRTQIRPQQ